MVKCSWRLSFAEFPLSSVLLPLIFFTYLLPNFAILWGYVSCQRVYLFHTCVYGFSEAPSCSKVMVLEYFLGQFYFALNLHAPPRMQVLPDPVVSVNYLWIAVYLYNVIPSVWINICLVWSHASCVCLFDWFCYWEFEVCWLWSLHAASFGMLYIMFGIRVWITIDSRACCNVSDFKKIAELRYILL